MVTLPTTLDWALLESDLSPLFLNIQLAGTSALSSLRVGLTVLASEWRVCDYCNNICMCVRVPSVYTDTGGVGNISFCFTVATFHYTNKLISFTNSDSWIFLLIEEIELSVRPELSQFYGFWYIVEHLCWKRNCSISWILRQFYKFW